MAAIGVIGMLKRLKLALTALSAITVIGIIGFMLIEKLPVWDAAYLTVVTIATIGYGDIVPQTAGGRVFTVFLIIVGVGTAYYTFSLMVTLTIEGELKNVLGRRGMNQRIQNLDKHIIVCGAGKVSANIIERLQHEQEAFVVIEENEQRYKSLIEDKVLTVLGDATLDEVLIEAGVGRARGIITALPDDAHNVYVVLTAKSLNPQIVIVARAERPEAEEKLRRAGANTVIFPSVMGGRQMVTALTRPVIMDFVENVFYNQELHLDIAEIQVFDQSPLAGLTLAQAGIKDKYNSIVVAVKRKDQLISNPQAAERIMPGDIMVVLGHRDMLSELNRLTNAV